MKIQNIYLGLVCLPVFCLSLIVGESACADAKQVSEVHWTDVERIVAIGDIHGDYDQYMKVLATAGLIDRKGKWAGGETHLVQTGDVPDRGPDTLKIIEHLRKLQKEAKRKGGRVHTLIGNHDAMNVYGDLRYVTPGEYGEFIGKNSAKLQNLQFEHHLQTMEARDPEGFAELDVDAFRKEWEKTYPLGWVEHRQAWGVSGDVGEWVMENPVVLKINDTLFMHGGLSAKYCKPELDELTTMVHEAMISYDYHNPGIVEDPLGPLWYRGLAMDGYAERGAMVDAILERHNVKRMVLGHTPTRGVVWPRFDSKIILNDTGMAAYYGGHIGFLEITPEGLVAVYGRDQRIELPEDDAGRVGYLKQVVSFDSSNAHLQSRLQKLTRASRAKALDSTEGSEEETSDTEESSEAAEALSAEAAQMAQWLSPDNCQ